MQRAARAHVKKRDLNVHWIQGDLLHVPSFNLKACSDPRNLVYRQTQIIGMNAPSFG